jgi:hypothetical protein
VKVAGIETDMPCAEISVNIEDSDFSDDDRQMLTRVVQRWDSLSEELKKAFLLGGGVGLDSATGWLKANNI